MYPPAIAPVALSLAFIVLTQRLRSGPSGSTPSMTIQLSRGLALAMLLVAAAHFAWLWLSARAISF